MSQWTHVSGIIRIDSFDMLTGRPDTQKHLERILQASRITYGSEGPILWSVEETRERSSMSWGHISLWGDLRDFGEEEVPLIEQWWHSIHFELRYANYMIRDSILKVTPENGEDTILLTLEEK